MPPVGGVFVQMEDELASMNAVLGGSWAGVKSMTATSGPGFSLMMENLGLGIMLETPCVLVNVQRGGPSTGLPTLVGQQDVVPRFVLSCLGAVPLGRHVCRSCSRIR